MNPDLVHQSQGRTLRAGLTVAAVWFALVTLWLGLEAAPWLVAFLGLFTLPALWDLITDPSSGLTLSDTNLTWFSGKRHGTIQLDEIDQVRLDTRLDFSVRVTVVLNTGTKIRLPFETTPPHQELEDALDARGVPTRRTHFQLMQ